MRPLCLRFPLAVVPTVLALLLLSHSSSGNAQRLPQTVRPEHYTLTLAPDLKAATFTGRETIDVVIDQPVDVITLNSAEIKFESVTTTLDGKSLTAKVSEDADKQQATFDFGQKLPAGKLTLEIR